VKVGGEHGNLSPDSFKLGEKEGNAKHRREHAKNFPRLGKANYINQEKRYYTFGLPAARST